MGGRLPAIQEHRKICQYDWGLAHVLGVHCASLFLKSSPCVSWVLATWSYDVETNTQILAVSLWLEIQNI